MTSFDRDILKALESLFEDGEIEALTRRPDPGDPTQDLAVKVIHKPTGLECVANEFESQIKNKSMALVGLLALLRSQTSTANS